MILAFTAPSSTGRRAEVTDEVCCFVTNVRQALSQNVISLLNSVQIARILKK